MFDKLDFITEKYQELSGKVADPAIISDQKTWQKYMKEMAEIEPIVKSYESYRKMQADLADAREIIDMEDDEEMRELAKEEAKELEDQMAKAQEELKILLSDLQVATDHAPSELKVAFSSLASEISRTGTLKIEKLPLCVSAVETGLGVFSAFGIAPAGHSNLLEKLKKLAEEH